MGEQSVLEPINIDSSALSAPVRCQLPMGGKEGSRYLKLELEVPRCAAATSPGGLGDPRAQV